MLFNQCEIMAGLPSQGYGKHLLFLIYIEFVSSFSGNCTSVILRGILQLYSKFTKTQSLCGTESNSWVQDRQWIQA